MSDSSAVTHWLLNVHVTDAESAVRQRSGHIGAGKPHLPMQEKEVGPLFAIKIIITRSIYNRFPHVSVAFCYNTAGIKKCQKIVKSIKKMVETTNSIQNTNINHHALNRDNTNTNKK